MFYGKLAEHLAASHRVERFAYDWRQPLDVLGERFGEFLSSLLQSTDQPVRLLAHSMGNIIVAESAKDDLLTDVMIYWATQTAASSTRIYYENRVAPPVPGRVTVPTACALFPKEITTPPRKWLLATRGAWG